MSPDHKPICHWIITKLWKVILLARDRYGAEFADVVFLGGLTDTGVLRIWLYILPFLYFRVSYADWVIPRFYLKPPMHSISLCMSWTSKMKHALCNSWFYITVTCRSYANTAILENLGELADDITLMTRRWRGDYRWVIFWPVFPQPTPLPQISPQRAGWGGQLCPVAAASRTWNKVISLLKGPLATDTAFQDHVQLWARVRCYVFGSAFTLAHVPRSFMVIKFYRLKYSGICKFYVLVEKVYFTFKVEETMQNKNCDVLLPSRLSPFGG